MRVLVLGLPGSGKTTMAKALASQLKISHIEVDRYFWKAAPVSDQELRDSIRPFLEGSDWIVEGHFSKLLSEILPRVDRIVWLDYPFLVTLRRALMRALGERNLSWSQRVRFLKLRNRRELNALFEKSFKEASDRGVQCQRITKHR